jgi:hypothetical protein
MCIYVSDVTAGSRFFQKLVVIYKTTGVTAQKSVTLVISVTRNETSFKAECILHLVGTKKTEFALKAVGVEQYII